MSSKVSDHSRAMTSDWQKLTRCARSVVWPTKPHITGVSSRRPLLLHALFGFLDSISYD